MAKSRPLLTALILLWLVGNALRMPLLAVPPVIPILRDEIRKRNAKFDKPLFILEQ